eukprot:jgi/Mesen1/7940/ME000422S07100
MSSAPSLPPSPSLPPFLRSPLPTFLRVALSPALQQSSGETGPEAQAREERAARAAGDSELWVLNWLKQWDPCVFGASVSATPVEVLAALRRSAVAAAQAGPKFRAGTSGRGFGGQQKKSFQGGSNGSSSYGQGRGNRWGGNREKGRGDFSGGGATNSYGDGKSRSQSRYSDDKGPSRERYDGNAGSSAAGGGGGKGAFRFGPAAGGGGGSKADRPEEKVLLLCGAPGLSKTTLAHVAAKHCGYRAVEVNASDDRAASTLRARILDAVQMQSVVAGDRRPNCVIIDEIDGAVGGPEGKGAINALIEIVHAEKKAAEVTRKRKAAEDADATGGEQGEGGGQQQHAKKPSSRKRAATGGIRKLTRPPGTTRVVSRLKHICQEEGFKVEPRALTALALHTECDIRSCLNTLQFLHRNGKALRADDVGAQVIGRKDTAKSMFDIWQEVFQRKKPRAGADHPLTDGAAAQHAEFNRFHSLLANHGDHDMVMDGVHENFLKMRYHDASLEKTMEALEWMADADMLHHRTVSRQQFFLTAYRPAAVVRVRSLLAGPERPYLEWPKASARHRTERAARQELLHTWHASMAPAVGRLMSASQLALDVVSPLLTILVPPTLRPVASQLMTDKERAELAGVVDSMIGLGLSYKLPRGGGLSEGSAGLQDWMAATSASLGLLLDPPLASLVAFAEYAPQHRQLSAPLRAIVEVECIRRVEAERKEREELTAIRHASRNGCHEMLAGGLSEKPNARIGPVAPSSIPPASGTSAAAGEHVAASTGQDGRGPACPTPVVTTLTPRELKSKPKEAKKNEEDARMQVEKRTADRDALPILYKFHEGFTNAVRRPVLIRELL